MDAAFPHRLFTPAQGNGGQVLKPNFLIIGAGKSGTTSLYDYLTQHPDVYMSEPKEPRFFDHEYNNGFEFYWRTYFRGWKGQRAVGEASTRNLYLPYVPKRIRESLPEAKLIAILRNPVDRAFSSWWMRYSRGNEPLSFEDAISESLKSVKNDPGFDGPDGERLWKDAVEKMGKGIIPRRIYLEMGYYAQQVNRYLLLFPRSQVKVVLFEDLFPDPESLIRELWSHVGVDPESSLQDKSPKNVAISEPFVPFVKVAISTGITKIIPVAIKNRIAVVLSRIGGRPRMNESTRRWLLTHYQPYNRELELLLGRDLSHWKR